MTIKNEPKMIDRFFASSDLENSNPRRQPYIIADILNYFNPRFHFKKLFAL
jgi:hypothetical protein